MIIDQIQTCRHHPLTIYTSNIGILSNHVNGFNIFIFVFKAIDYLYIHSTYDMDWRRLRIRIIFSFYKHLKKFETRLLNNFIKFPIHDLLIYWHCNINFIYKKTYCFHSCHNKQNQHDFYFSSRQGEKLQKKQKKYKNIQIPKVLLIFQTILISKVNWTQKTTKKNHILWKLKINIKASSL